MNSRAFPTNLQHLSVQNDLDLMPQAFLVVREKNGSFEEIPTRKESVLEPFCVPQSPRSIKSFLSYLSSDEDCKAAFNSCHSGTPVHGAVLELLDEAVLRYTKNPKVIRISQEEVESDPVMKDLLRLADLNPSIHIDPHSPPCQLSVAEKTCSELIDGVSKLHTKVHEVSTQAPTLTWVVHLSTLLLHSLLRCINPSLIDIKKRASAVSMLIKNILCPAPDPEVRNEIYLISVVGLGILLPEEMRIPRDTLDLVIRPVLKPLCQVENITAPEHCPSLMSFLGLSHTVDLIPQLFNNAFATRVVTVISLYSASDRPLFKCPERHQIIALLIRLFRSMSRKTDCSIHIDPICKAVSPYISDHLENIELKHDLNNIGHSLMQFLCCYPQVAADTLLLSQNTPIRTLLLELRTFPRSSIATELHKRFTRGLSSSAGSEGFVMNPELSDVTLVVGPSQLEIPAHRIVLFRSNYFVCLFKNGMLETGCTRISLPEVEESSFKFILYHIYGNPLPLPEKIEELIPIFIAAGYFCLPDLQTECEVRITRDVTPENVLAVIDASDSAGMSGDEWSVLDQACRDALFAKPQGLTSLNIHDPTTRRILCKPLSIYY